MVVMCLERGGNDLHMVQLFHCHPIISSFIKIQYGLTFLVPAYPGCPGKETVKRESVEQSGEVSLVYWIDLVSDH